jgi:hypothetical protein
MRPMLMVLVVALAALGAAGAHAGECVESPEAYVADLERGPAAAEFRYAIGCLADACRIGTTLWAGPNAAARFAAQRSDTLRTRIAAAVTDLLTSVWADEGENRRALYRIAAGYGIARLDTVDVFARLFTPGTHPWHGDYVDMAILRDCRAVGLLRSRYDELRAHPELGYTDEIIDLLSCLYHLPCEAATTMATDLVAGETEARLLDRLAKVLESRR